MAREKECRAYTIKCTKREKMWHLVSLCRSKTRKVAAGEEDVNKEVTNGTVEYGFYAITVGSGDFPTTPDRVAHSPAVPTAIRFSPSSTHQSPARLALLQPPPTNISHTFCGTVRDEIRKGKEI